MNVQRPGEMVFDPDLAATIAERLALGMHPSAIAHQLSAHADADAVAAYVDEAQNDPFFQGAMALSDAARKRDWILECQATSWRNAPELQTIERCSKLSSEDFLRDFYANQRPAVISGLVDDWPALTRWNPDYFDAKIGRDTEVEVQKGRSTTTNYEVEKTKCTTIVPFGEVSDILRSGESSNDLYVTANNGSKNRQAFDPLWADFGLIPGYTAPEHGNDGYLWIGPGGTVTPFHHDLTNNLLVQVRGRKRIHMVPNWEESRMKPRGRVFSNWTLDEIMAAGEAGPAVLETEIGPGDALFIPVGWWHHVIGLDQSYSILFTNFRWPNFHVNDFMRG